jgi:cytidylate kinase
MKNMIVTIDGPAGAGKTTVSRMLAEKLGYRYLDTGALYRGVAFEVKSTGIKYDDDEALMDLCSRITLTFVHEIRGLRLLSNGMDITDHIRTSEITMLASAVSARAVVREYLLAVQRNIGRQGSIVAEGRDMGTVVFPDADVKFFLDADPDERAKRRFGEIKQTSNQTLTSVKQDIIKRDHNDSSRELAPLKPAADAIIIDSTYLSAEAVVEFMLGRFYPPPVNR